MGLVTEGRSAAVTFLRTAYRDEDWVAVFLKNYRTGATAQRVLPAVDAASDRFQAWLRYMNARRWNVYVSVNAVRPGRSRTRGSVAAIRHVFLEDDIDGLELVAALATCPELPPVSYVTHSSPNRLHLLWRASGFEAEQVEGLQRHLARWFGTDTAATSCAQMTRLPGFVNYKRERRWRVSSEYLYPGPAFVPADFPAPDVARPRGTEVGRIASLCGSAVNSRLLRARQFLQKVEPAVAGQHGDLRTFRICCRLVRGFDLSDSEAIGLLEEWNSSCLPPWSMHELEQKVANARLYGREPFGGLLRDR